MNKNVTRKLTESAVMIATATVLSMLKLIDLPYGGSVTLCSMLPVMLIGYRFGIGAGLLGGFAYSVIQLLLGLNTLAYATSAAAAVAIVFLDYIFAFTFIGLGGVFKKLFKNQSASMCLGMLLVCLIRYIFHTVSGCTVWAGLSIPTEKALLYSLSYNATYMLPELLVSLLITFYISAAVDFRGEKLIRKVKSENKADVFTTAGIFTAVVTLIADFVIAFSKLQNAESGEFDISGIANINVNAVLWVTVIGAVVALILFFAGKAKKSNK